MAFLSIIIPTYNEERLIAVKLKAIQGGLTLPHEIIVTDDFSLDSTREQAQPFADIVLCPEKKHPTIAANRNTGAKVAKGNFLVFMDIDSTTTNYNAFFVRALKDFEENPKLVALTGFLKVLPEYETFTDKCVYFFFNRIHILKNNIFHSGEASGKFQMIKREAFHKVNGFREDLVTREDADIFQRLSKIGQTYCDRHLVIYHTGRRAHIIGWPKLLSIWMINTMWVSLFNKAYTKSWNKVD
jgi:glycosyltransferase involved in cell wall biosynthesis